MDPFTIRKNGNASWWSRSGGTYFYSITGVGVLVMILIAAGVVLFMRIGDRAVARGPLVSSFGREPPSVEKQLEEGTTGKKSTKRKRQRRKMKLNIQSNFESTVLEDMKGAFRELKRLEVNYEVSKRDDLNKDTTPPLILCPELDDS